MTTLAKSERPERLSDDRFRYLDDPLHVFTEPADPIYDEMRTEARGARAEESRLSRELEATEHLIDAYASELGTLVCQVLEADSRAGGYRTAAKRLAACFERLDQQIVGFALDAGMSPTISNTRCVYCGEQRPAKGTWEGEAAVWIEHAKTCPRHPWRETEWERDVAQAVAKEAGRQLGEAGAARLRAECERDDARRRLDAAENLASRQETDLKIERQCMSAVEQALDVPTGINQRRILGAIEILKTRCETAEADRDVLGRSNASLARERDLAIEAHHNATAERDAARKEAERLRNEMSTMRPNLGWDDNEFK